MTPYKSYPASPQEMMHNDDMVTITNQQASRDGEDTRSDGQQPRSQRRLIHD